MRLLAPAKINLHLRVGAPAPDGFHPISSWMCTVGLFDTIFAGESDSEGVALQCDGDGLPVPCDESNLIVRVGKAFAVALRDSEVRWRGRALGADISLHKRIPIGAGLGGGSSDGIRALGGLNRLWRAGWERERLAGLAAKIGSDMPFFLYEPSAVCTGRGEIVAPIPPPAVRFALLVLPEIHMPTPAVYRQFDELGLGQASDDSQGIRSSPPWQDWLMLSAGELLPRLANDLEPAAFSLRPDLGRLRETIDRILTQPVRMSGSGSSLFTLYDTQGEAEGAAQKIRAQVGVRAVAVPLAPKIDDDLNK